MSKTSGTIDLKSLKTASTEATNYVTDIDNNGISIHPKGDNSNKITISSAIEIFKNAVSYLKIWVEEVANSTPIAKIRIGKDNSAHFLIQDEKIIGYGNANDIYFETGNGGNTIVQKFTGDGSNKIFEVYYATEVSSVTVNGTAVSYTLSNPIMVTLTSAPSDGAEVIITYTSQETAPYFTFGTRFANSNIGIGSASFGDHNKATGIFSLAEGTVCESSGFDSHAEGFETVASGSHAHAEGQETVASGTNSHAGGSNSIASGINSFAHGDRVQANKNGSMAVGYYNNPTACLFSVGNGTSATRKNAFSVIDSGNCYIGGRYLSGTIGDFIPTFRVSTYTQDNISITANSTMGAKSISIGVTGYTPVAIATQVIENATSSGANASNCYLYTYGFDGNTLKYNGRNIGTAAAKIKVTFTVLYIATIAL